MSTSARSIHVGTSRHADRSIDRVAGATFGAEEVSAGAYHGSGKSFFLTTDQKSSSAKRLVSTDRDAVRRALLIQDCALSLIAWRIGLSVAWLTSYRKLRT